MGRLDVNVCIGEVTAYDARLFFGDNAGRVPVDDTFLDVGKNFLPDANPEALDFAKLLAGLGVFRSRSDAARNGWGRPIPEGWTELRVGKLKHRICVLKNLTRW